MKKRKRTPKITVRNARVRKAPVRKASVRRGSKKTRSENRHSPRPQKGGKATSRRVSPVGRVRLLIGKVGLDGHDRGVKVIARALRDAGYEVIYTGLHQTPEMVVNAAIQEDVNAIGLSILSGAHMTHLPRVLSLRRERGAGDIVVFGGGIIPEEDIPVLKKLGVREIFTPGASTRDVIEFVRREVEAPRK